MLPHRLLYYITPFALSLMILGGRELLIAVRGTPLPPVRTLHSLAPTEVANAPSAEPRGGGKRSA